MHTPRYTKTAYILTKLFTEAKCSSAPEVRSITAVFEMNENHKCISCAVLKKLKHFCLIKKYQKRVQKSDKLSSIFLHIFCYTLTYFHFRNPSKKFPFSYLLISIRISSIL